MAQSLTLLVDGKSHTITVDDPDMPLIYALRDELSTIRASAGLAQCGACTVNRRESGAVLHHAGRLGCRSQDTTIAGLGTPRSRTAADRLDRGAGQPARHASTAGS